MALQLSFEVPGTGIVVPEGYFRIAEVTLDSARGIATVSMSIYKDVAVRNAGATPLPDSFIPLSATVLKIVGREYTTYFGDAVFEAGGTNPRRQAYLCLATRDFFANALSV